jgi:hypothetical protein
VPGRRRSQSLRVSERVAIIGDGGADGVRPSVLYPQEGGVRSTRSPNLPQFAAEMIEERVSSPREGFCPAGHRMAVLADKSSPACVARAPIILFSTSARVGCLRTCTKPCVTAGAGVHLIELPLPCVYDRTPGQAVGSPEEKAMVEFFAPTPGRCLHRSDPNAAPPWLALLRYRRRAPGFGPSRRARPHSRI